MKKKLYKLLSAFLVVTLLWGILPVNGVLAAEIRPMDIMPPTEEHYAEIINEVMDNLENGFDPELEQFLTEFETLAYAHDSVDVDLDEPYHTKRLLVAATSYVDYEHLGAIETIRGPNNITVLQFATIEDAKEAHNKLDNLQGVVDAMTSLNIHDYGDSITIMPFGTSCGHDGKWDFTYGSTTWYGGGWSTLYINCGRLCGMAPALLELAILALMTAVFPGVGTAVAGIIVSVHLVMLRQACSDGGHHGASIDVGKVALLPVTPSANRIYSQARPTFSISYNANGGSGAPSASTKTCCSTLWLSSTRPTHSSGRTFLGWSTSSTATTAPYAAGSAFTLCGSNRTLYAVWSRIITWNYNGGTGSPTSSFLAPGTAFGTVPTPNDKTGYSFGGWFNTSAATGGTPITGSSTVPSSDTTYWARWNANTYTVNLDKTGGTGGPASIIATYDAAIPTITPPTRTGYTFTGYWDAITDGTQYYTSSGASARTWDKTSITTLYARWSAVAPTITSANNYTVTYGTGGTFQVTVNGAAPITYSFSGLPIGVSIDSDSCLITIAATTTVGDHIFTITASNGVYPDATQSFILTVTPGNTKLGDISGDGKVDSTDLILLLSDFGKFGADIVNLGSDINGDGKVDSTDLIALLSNFGS